jgi:vitamin B12 transporter
MIKKIKPAIIAALGLILFSVPPSIGMAGEHKTEKIKDDGEEKNVLKIDEMVVTSRKIEERLSAELAEYGHKVEIITYEDISKGGFTDVNQILESLVPGLYVTTKGGRGDYMRMSLNGGDTKQVVFLIDGVRINNRLFGRGYLDTLSPQMLERIEILKNGEGLFYGTDSVTGVINFITKKITKDRHGSIGTGAGSFKASEAHGLLTDTINDNGFLVFGSYDGWDGFQPFNDEDYDRIDGANKKDRGYDRKNIMGKYQRHLNLGNGAEIQASCLRNAAKLDYVRVNEDEALNDRTEYVGILKWDHNINDDFSYYIKGYYHEWWTDYTRQKLDGTFIFNDAEWGYEDWGFNIMGSWFFHDNNELLFGYDYQNYHGHDEVMEFYSDHEEVNAVFAAVRPYFSFFPDLRLSLGGRYNKTGDSDKFVWNVSARTPVWGTLYARASVSTNFRLANAWELYATDDLDWGVGNPDLDPEESMNYEFGVGFSYHLFSAEVNYSYTKIEDMIGKNDDNVFINTDKEVTLENIEFQISSKPVYGFNCVISVSFTEAEEKGSSDQLAKIPKSLYKGIFNYNHPEKGFGGSITTRYVGEVLSGNYFGRSYDTYYGEHWLTDLSLFYRFGSDHAHMLTMRIDNLFDRDYDNYGHQKATDSSGELFIYPFRGAPRTLMLSYKYTF